MEELVKTFETNYTPKKSTVGERMAAISSTQQLLLARDLVQLSSSAAQRARTALECCAQSASAVFYSDVMCEANNIIDGNILLL